MSNHPCSREHGPFCIPFFANMIDVPIECCKCHRGTLEPIGIRLSNGSVMIGCDECPYTRPAEADEAQEINEALNT